jgi:hypothetical protein
LTWLADTPEGWAIKFTNPQDYLDILHNIQRLPSLDDRVQECLDRLGQGDPMQVIDFMSNASATPLNAMREATNMMQSPSNFPTPLKAYGRVPHTSMCCAVLETGRCVKMFGSGMKLLAY